MILKKREDNWKLKEEAVDGTLWSIRLGPCVLVGSFVSDDELGVKVMFIMGNLRLLWRWCLGFRSSG